MAKPYPELAGQDTVERWLVTGALERYVQHRPTETTGGCNACAYADPLSDRLCTLADISAADFDLGVSGLNCTRFVPAVASEAVGSRPQA